MSTPPSYPLMLSTCYTLLCLTPPTFFSFWKTTPSIKTIQSPMNSFACSMVFHVPNASNLQVETTFSCVLPWMLSPLTYSTSCTLMVLVPSSRTLNPVTFTLSFAVFTFLSLRTSATRTLLVLTNFYFVPLILFNPLLLFPFPLHHLHLKSPPPLFQKPLLLWPPIMTMTSMKSLFLSPPKLLRLSIFPMAPPSFLLLYRFSLDLNKSKSPLPL